MIIKVKCKKDVVMKPTGTVAFIKDKQYTVTNPKGYYLDVINEQGESHGIGPVGDGWTREYFELIRRE